MKLNRLMCIHLSPQFSPLFPCTIYGKPVLPYRGLWRLSVSDSPSPNRFKLLTSIAPEVDIFRFLFARVKQKMRPVKKACCPLKDRRLFGLPKYVLIRGSQFSRLE